MPSKLSLEIDSYAVIRGSDHLSSVAEWLTDLRRGDEAAARHLWEHYAEKLVQLARSRLGDAPRRMLDEEDIVQSVFGTICRGAAAGRFANLQSRDELWWLLLSITHQKTVNYFRRETARKRGGGRTRYEQDGMQDANGAPACSFDDLVGPTPTPEFLVSLEEQYQTLLGMLRDDTMRRVAIARVEGYTVGEIAERLAISRRAVERKLQLIRGKWSNEWTSNLDG